MRAALLSLVVLAATTGCKVKNPHFCEPSDGVTCPDGGVDAPEKCSDSDPCASGVCKEPPGVCVECLTNAECTSAAEPACNTMTNTCGKCTEHSDCADSDVCLPDGTCAAQGMVAYLAPSPTGTDNQNCTKLEKCTDFAKALGTNRAYIKVEGTHASNITINRTVTVLAEKTAKVSPPSGTIVTLRGNASTNINIVGLQIDGGGNQTLGVSVPNGESPTVTLDRCLVARNDSGGLVVGGGDFTLRNSRVEANQGGGFLLNGGAKYAITNNFIITNGLDLGSPPSQFGGLSLTSNVAGNKLEFNTIALNRSDGTLPAGVSCAGPMSVVNGNIIYANQLPGNDVSMNAQTGTGNCTYQASNFISGVNVGIAQDLGFESPRMTPISFKLTANSPAQVKDVVMSGCPATDFEGDTRPSGTGCELGADELK